MTLVIEAKRNKKEVVILLVGLVVACNSLQEPIIETIPPGNIQEQCFDLGEGWSVPKLQVVGGGVGKDGIPAIENPEFIHTSEVQHLLDDEIVIGINVGGVYRAYPHRIMEKHEVVNDVSGDEFFSLTFCPLTGTSLTWQREADNSFGVSGLLHNSNLIAYDRKTETNYSQIYSKGINGLNICSTLNLNTTIEMSWRAWRELFPDSYVLSSDTGFKRNYNGPPESFIQNIDASPRFPLNNIDNRLPTYERVLLVVVDGAAKAYQLSNFGSGTDVVVDFLAGKQVTLVGNEELNFMVSFLNKQGITIIGVDGGNLMDSNGSRYSLFGESISDENLGENLEVPYSMMGYWFAVAAFYPEVEIFVDGEM